MKFDCLRAIAHNFADSLASGCSSLLAVYTDVTFQEAARRRDGVVAVDLLRGTVVGECGAGLFPGATEVFGTALALLCQRHGTSPAIFQRLEACFVSEPQGRRFVVTVQDQTGRLAVDEYQASGARFRRMDQVGRVRRKRGAVRDGQAAGLPEAHSAACA